MKTFQHQDRFIETLLAKLLRGSKLKHRKTIDLTAQYCRRVQQAVAIGICFDDPQHLATRRDQLFRAPGVMHERRAGKNRRERSALVADGKWGVF